MPAGFGQEERCEVGNLQYGSHFARGSAQNQPAGPCLLAGIVFGHQHGLDRGAEKATRRASHFARHHGPPPGQWPAQSPRKPRVPTKSCEEDGAPRGCDARARAGGRGAASWPSVSGAVGTRPPAPQRLMASSAAGQNTFPRRAKRSISIAARLPGSPGHAMQPLLRTLHRWRCICAPHQGTTTAGGTCKPPRLQALRQAKRPASRNFAAASPARRYAPTPASLMKPPDHRPENQTPAGPGCRRRPTHKIAACPLLAPPPHTLLAADYKTVPVGSPRLRLTITNLRISLHTPTLLQSTSPPLPLPLPLPLPSPGPSPQLTPAARAR
jgi:hypothetical protein